MIKIMMESGSQTGQIILRPNLSLSWQKNLYFLGFLICISLTIGIGFLFAGAWMVLPYSILEMAVLAICIMLCVKQCYRQEVITLFDHEVVIEKGYFEVNKRWSYPRLWSKFIVKPNEGPWGPKTVTLRSHGEEIEIGSFLNEEDKEILIEQLRVAVIR